MQDYIIQVQFKSGQKGMFLTSLFGDTIEDAAKTFALLLEHARQSNSVIVLPDLGEDTMIAICANEVEAVVFGDAQ